MFIDQARIHVKAGAGGNGCRSFFRLRTGKLGKANGGDGGKGGDINIISSRHIQTLLDFKYNKKFTSERGWHGSSNYMTGASGEDSKVLVPCGTVIRDAASGLVLRDLTRDGETVTIAKGGRGGHGNSKRRDATSGAPGDEKELILELKLIADVGLIGYPNAGKSTIISNVSSAKSKIAGYPFTTKEPILGMVRHHDDVLVFADMPGLIDGAHKGRGLGDRFLRHIERTKILLHVVDVSGFERTDPLSDIAAIKNELGQYSGELLKKKRFIVLNKTDVPESEKFVKEIRKKIKEKVFPISAVTGDGIKPLLDAVFDYARQEMV